MDRIYNPDNDDNVKDIRFPMRKREVDELYHISECHLTMPGLVNDSG
jgi:hypothetical protein